MPRETCQAGLTWLQNLFTKWNTVHKWRFMEHTVRRLSSLSIRENEVICQGLPGAGLKDLSEAEVFLLLGSSSLSQRPGSVLEVHSLFWYKDGNNPEKSPFSYFLKHMMLLVIWLCKPWDDCFALSVTLSPLKLNPPSAAGFNSNFTLLTCIIAALIINCKAHLTLSSLGSVLPVPQMRWGKAPTLYSKVWVV